MPNRRLMEIYGFESARAMILWYLEKGDNCNG